VRSLNIFSAIVITACFVAAMYFFFSARQLIANSEQTEATVVESERYRDRDGDRYYVTRLEFVELEGRTITIEAGGSETVGERLEVIYDPDNPEDAKLRKNVFDATGRVIAFGFLYTAMYLYGVVKRWRGRRKKEKWVARQKGVLFQAQAPPENYVVEPAHNNTDKTGKLADDAGSQSQRNYIVDPVTDESE